MKVDEGAFEDEEEYQRVLEAINELRKDYGPPESYPKYEGWKLAIFSAN